MSTFCPSYSTRNMLLSQGFDNLRLWPRGIDTSLFSPIRYNPKLRKRWMASLQPKLESKITEDIVITYVGRLSTEKNIDLLINSFIRLNGRLSTLGENGPSCRLVLVGEGPARKRLQEQTRNLNVIFMGYQKEEALAECYASSDIFAFPSHSETFGNVVLEAMASGLPVVGLRAEGISDLVESGKTGTTITLVILLPGLIVSQPSRLSVGTRKSTWSQHCEEC